MEWTKEPPKEPGYYWWRNSFRETDVVKVCEWGTLGELVAFKFGLASIYAIKEGSYDLLFFGGEWGPRVEVEG